MLHVTNGHSAVAVLRSGGIEDDILPWEDVLHEGPVKNLPPAELADLRAGHIASLGWGEREEALNAFRMRDVRLQKAVGSGEEICLWFEPDLYDQLQLIQLLDRLASFAGSVLLIQTEYYLGEMGPEQAKSLFASCAECSADQRALGRRAWEAFTDDEPVRWHGLLGGDLSALPFLQAAVERFLQEFPAPVDGLSRTERFILEKLSQEEQKPGALFWAMQQAEEYKFMGDWSFFERLKELSAGDRPLIQCANGGPFEYAVQQSGPPTGKDAVLRLTEDGERALGGKLDRAQMHGFERFLGGVRLENGSLWRFISEKREISKDFE